MHASTLHLLLTRGCTYKRNKERNSFKEQNELDKK